VNNLGFSYGDHQCSIFFLNFVMGIFEWPSHTNFFSYEALDSPKINTLKSLSFGLLIWVTKVEMKAI
jgi:hypothetical protein